MESVSECLACKFSVNGRRRTVSNSRETWVTEDAVLMIVGEVACLSEVARRETVGEGAVVNGLDVHVVIDLPQAS